MKEAYWITNKGKIVELPSGSFHYQLVMNQPELFGLSSRDIDKIKKPFGTKPTRINKDGEVVSLENEIRSPMIQQGNIRIRFRDRENSYTLELSELDDNTKLYIDNWIQKEKIKNVGLTIIQHKTGDMDFYNTIKEYSKKNKPTETKKASKEDSDWHTADPVKKDQAYKSGKKTKVVGKVTTGGFDTPAEYHTKSVVGDSVEVTRNILKKLIED